MTKRNRHDKLAKPHYVQIFTAILKEPSWLAMTFGARALYILLKSYYNGENNGRIYIGVRRAAKELGAGRASTERWFRILHDHGFIRVTQGAFLGVEGKGLATHWRLTEIGYMGDQPTREFKSWQPLEKKTPPSKRGRTVLKMMTRRPQNDDALAPSGTPDRHQNDGISTSPYVVPIAPSTNTVTGRSLQSSGAVAYPFTSRSPSGSLAFLERRLKRREPITGEEMHTLLTIVDDIIETEGDATLRSWAEGVRAQLEARAA